MTTHNGTNQQPDSETRNENTVANESEAADSVDTEANGADTSTIIVDDRRRSGRLTAVTH
jgi:hypothetical protein